MPLSEEIAVLDGLGDIPSYANVGAQFDVTAGANYSGGSSWNPAMPLTPSNAGLADADLEGAYRNSIPNYENVGAQFDVTAGANYSGGSSWNPAMPLTPSNAGLADADLEGMYRKAIPSYANVGAQFDVTAGANYSGGSSWNPAMPLTPSNAGLASLYDGRTLEAAFAGAYGSTMEAIPSYANVGAQFDVTAGANYSGGSSWNPAMPLTPSNAGLAGLAELSAIEPLDAMPDAMFKNALLGNQKMPFMRMASKQKIMGLKKAALQAARSGNLLRALRVSRALSKAREVRRNVLGVKRCGNNFIKNPFGRCVPGPNATPLQREAWARMKKTGKYDPQAIVRERGISKFAKAFAR